MSPKQNQSAKTKVVKIPFYIIFGGFLAWCVTVLILLFALGVANAI